MISSHPSTATCCCLLLLLLLQAQDTFLTGRHKGSRGAEPGGRRSGVSLLCFQVYRESLTGGDAGGEVGLKRHASDTIHPGTSWTLS